MPVIELTRTNFHSTIAEHPLVIVDFWASWCGPCRAFAPVFEAAAAANPDVVFAKVDTEAEPELADAFSIRSIPTLMVFREQVILYAEAGSLPGSALNDILTQARALDMAEVRRELAAQATDAP